MKRNIGSPDPFRRRPSAATARYLAQLAKWRCPCCLRGLCHSGDHAMIPLVRLSAASHSRTLVCLIGADLHRRAAICNAAEGEYLHIEPVESVDDLGERDCVSAGA